MEATTLDPTAIAAAVLEQLETAWNGADGAAFSEVFLDDAEFVDIRGCHHRGRADIAVGHQGIFDTIYAGSTNRYDLDVARVIAPGCVLVVATSTLDAPTGPLQGINQSRFSFTMTEHREGWAIAGFHNTLVLKEMKGLPSASGRLGQPVEGDRVHERIGVPVD